MKQNKRIMRRNALSSIPTRGAWITAAVFVVAVGVVFSGFRSSLQFFAAREEAGGPMTAASKPSFFGPTIPNTGRVPSPSPLGMVWISGGEFAMGAMDPPAIDEVGMHAAVDARPIHRVYVDGFWMDETDVTNEAFAKFVKATGYATVAERKPRAEDFPGAPP